MERNAEPGAAGPSTAASASASAASASAASASAASSASSASAAPNTPNTPSAGHRRKRRSAEDIRERVLAAASGAFARFGYAGATTAEIARNADVTEAQIFRYFASKAELFAAAVVDPLDRSFAAFNARMLGPEARTADGAAEYIAALQDFMERHSRPLLTAMVARGHEQAGGAGPAIGAGLGEYFEIGAAVMRRRTGGPARVPPELLVRVSFAAVLGCALFKDWLFPAGLADEAAIRQATIDFVVDGINLNPPNAELPSLEFPKP